MTQTDTEHPNGRRDLDEVLIGSPSEKRRLLLLVRTGLTLAIAYLLIFSTESHELPPAHLAFVVLYLGSNVLIATLPARVLASASFDVLLVLADTAATSFALYLIPEANTDVFVFYFVIVLLASISDRVTISLMAPIVTSLAYMAFLIARYGLDHVMQPAILLRMPFFLLAGAFYGFFVDRVRRGQIAAAEARQRELARTEFLSLITHDLKQPLWIAQQSASMLYDDLAADGGPRALAAQVMVSLRRMEALTLNFLDFGRMEDRGIKVFPQRASLADIVHDLIDSYRPAFELRNLHADVDLDPRVPPTVWLDGLQLQRALSNLIDNAIKFTPEHGTVFVRTRWLDHGVEIRIGDSGPGIADDRAANLFTRYQSGRDVAGRRSTGLGLYITHAIVSAHGGTISLDRQAPSGTWFRIELPARPAEAPARAETEQASLAPVAAA